MSSGSASYSVSATNYGRNVNDSYFVLSAPGVQQGNQEITGNLKVDGTTNLVGQVTCGAGLTAAGQVGAASLAVSGTSALTGAVSAGPITCTGAVAAASVSSTGAVTAASVAATGAMTAASVAASGALTAASAAVTGPVTIGQMAAGSVITGTFTGVLAAGASTNLLQVAQPCYVEIFCNANPETGQGDPRYIYQCLLISASNTGGNLFLGASGAGLPASAFGCVINAVNGAAGTATAYGTPVAINLGSVGGGGATQSWAGSYRVMALPNVLATYSGAITARTISTVVST